MNYQSRLILNKRYLKGLASVLSNRRRLCACRHVDRLIILGHNHLTAGCAYYAWGQFLIKYRNINAWIIPAAHIFQAMVSF